MDVLVLKRCSNAYHNRKGRYGLGRDLLGSSHFEFDKIFEKFEIHLLVLKLQQCLSQQDGEVGPSSMGTFFMLVLECADSLNSTGLRS